jgi:hypothetical protein
MQRAWTTFRNSPWWLTLAAALLALAGALLGFVIASRLDSGNGPMPAARPTPNGEQQYRSEDLAALMAGISADSGRWRATGVEISSLGVAGNRVHVTVVQLTPEGRAALEAEYGPMLSVSSVPEPACAGIGFGGLLVSIDSSGVVTGASVDPANLDNPSPKSHALTWPRGYELRAGPDGFEIVSPDGSMVIRNGTVLADGGICVGDPMRIADPGHILRP